MANTLRFKRGLVSTIPTALAGEPLFTTDTFDLYIGNGTTNTRFQKYIASGTTSQYLRGDGSLATFPTNVITGTGVAGQVAYWSGASTQTGSNNLFWDNTNGRLGIGLTTPLSSLHILSTATIPARFISSGALTSVILDNTNANLWGCNIDVRVNGNTQFNFGTLGSILGSTNYDATIYSRAGNGFRVNVNNSVTTSFFVSSTGNTILGSTSDTGQRLQVTGDTLLKGSGATSATTALLVENSDGSDILKIRNDGVLLIGNSANAAQVRPVNTSGILDLGGDALGFVAFATTNSAGVSSFNFTGTTLTSTSGFNGLISIYRQFAPTSGTAQATFVNINPTINQTGGANGITRGLYVNPTLTAAADWRSIEWSNNTGWGLYGAGSAQNFLAGNLGIGTTTINNSALRVNKAITGSTTQSSIANSSTINSDVTTAAWMYVSSPSTQAAAFTLAEVVHFNAFNLTIGAGSTVTNQFGFRANSNLTGATNNYGFYGDIAAATGRWNLYMNGTAANYLRGNTAINTTTINDNGLTINQSVNGSNVLMSLRNDAGGSDNEVSIKMIAGSFTAGEFGTILTHRRIGSGGAAFIIKTNATLGGTPIEAGRFTQSQNLHLGAFTSDSGEKLQVNGTMKVTGASTFGSSIIASGLVSAATEYRLNNNTFSRVAKIDAQGGFAGGYNVDIIAGPTVTHAETGAISGIRYAGNGNLFFFTNTSQAAGTTATTRMTLDTSGNLGLGVTPSATSGTYKNVQNGLATMMGSTSDASAYWNANATFNSGWKYIANGTSTRYEQGTGHFWFIAPSGTAGNAISYTQAMTLHSTGNLAIGTGSGADAGFRLDVNGTMRVSGASTFGGNMGLTLNQNAVTSLTISNTTDGTTAGSAISLTSDAASGTFTIGKRANLRTAYKILGGGDAQIYNSSGADISILNDAATGSIKMAAGGSSTAHFTIASTGAATFSSTAQAAGFITSGGTGYAVINSAATTVTALRPTGGGASIMSTNSNGLHIAVGTQAAGDLILASNNTERIRLSSNGFFSQLNATNPSASITDSYIQYSADVVAGNAAPHFRTENGAVIKLYQETTAVGNAIFSQGGGNAVLDDSTFAGYTLRQIVQALRNQGILQ